MVQPTSIRESLSFNADKANEASPPNKREHLDKWQRILAEIPKGHSADNAKIDKQVSEIQSVYRKSNIKWGLIITALAVIGVAALILGMGVAIGSLVGGMILLDTCLVGGIVLMSVGGPVGMITAGISGSAMMIGGQLGGNCCGNGWRPEEEELKQVISEYGLENIDFKNEGQRQALEDIIVHWNQARREAGRANEAFKTSNFSQFERNVNELGKSVDAMTAAKGRIDHAS